jgi:hypothetical protein
MAGSVFVIVIVIVQMLMFSVVLLRASIGMLKCFVLFGSKVRQLLDESYDAPHICVCALIIRCLPVGTQPH